jgi:hypothetical protein
MNDYKTCTHSYDSGRACKSAAAAGREFCGYHLHYRGRLLRMAQFRARHQPFDITLPPLDSLCSIQSALSQVAEALAADMIDPRRAMGLLKALRFAKENLKDGLKDDSAHWHDTPYLNKDATAYDNFEADYGLPEGIDLTAPPEVAFPSTDTNNQVGCPVQAQLERGFSPDTKSPGGPGCPIPPAFGGVGLSTGRPTLPSFDRIPLILEIPPPYVRDYAAEAEEAFECKPEDIELTELYNTEGFKAWDRRAREHQRNADRKLRRKLFRANYERYAAEAKLKNIQAAAEKLLAQKLAAEKAAAQQSATQKEAEQNSQPLPPTACETPDAPAIRRPPTPADAAADTLPKEATSIA